MIYFITDGRFIKVGTTARPISKRLAQMKSGNPFPLKLLAICEGDADLERRVHKVIGRRVRGSQEWFEPSLPLMRFIARVQSRGRTAVDARLAAKRRLEHIKKNRLVGFDDLFHADAVRLVEALCRKYGVRYLARVTGQCEAALRLQRRGTSKIGALALARLGAIEPEAISALIRRASLDSYIASIERLRLAA